MNKTQIFFDYFTTFMPTKYTRWESNLNLSHEQMMKIGNNSNVNFQIIWTIHDLSLGNVTIRTVPNSGAHNLLSIIYLSSLDYPYLALIFHFISYLSLIILCLLFVLLLGHYTASHFKSIEINDEKSYPIPSENNKFQSPRSSLNPLLHMVERIELEPNHLLQPIFYDPIPLKMDKPKQCHLPLSSQCKLQSEHIPTQFPLRPKTPTYEPNLSEYNNLNDEPISPSNILPNINLNTYSNEFNGKSFLNDIDSTSNSLQR